MSMTLGYVDPNRLDSTGTEYAHYKAHGTISGKIRDLLALSGASIHARSIKLWNDTRYNNIQLHDLIMDCKRIMEVSEKVYGSSTAGMNPNSKPHIFNAMI